MTVETKDGTTLATLSDVPKGTAWSISSGSTDYQPVLTIGDKSYTQADVSYTAYAWRLNDESIGVDDSGTITEDSTFTATTPD